MENKFVLFVIGEDRPGIVAAVSGVLYKNNFNIEDSSMTILERYFAMILIISSKVRYSIPLLKKKFKEVEKKLNLYISIKRIMPVREKEEIFINAEPHIITLIGSDRIGIVHKITNLIAERNINITDVKTEIIGEEKTPIYTMILELEIPPEINIKKFRSSLFRLEKELNVKITLKPIDILKL